ncbi:MAG: sel1 repeat family protein, partial [Candidatus Nitrotoga sp.]|nr:sel1 repeat family protein [Candidatus Nitrotoga sp.]
DNGQGVPQDFKEAVKWYRLAAEQGHALAQFNLGGVYDKGRGVAKDYKEAVRWYKLAAEQGDVDAQYNLGYMYAKGQGVLQDYIYAHMWFNLASMRGDTVFATKNRDFLAKLMTPQQIEKAQEMAKSCQARNFKGC